MRLCVCIPKVEPDVMDAPDVCPYPDCDGRSFKDHQQRCDRPLRDTQVDAVRRECLRCGRTHRVYPKGVSQAHHLLSY